MTFCKSSKNFEYLQKHFTSQDFQGKTVVSIDASAINLLKFQFSDGTSLELWIETVHVGNGNHLSHLYIDDKNYQGEEEKEEDTE